ncbi:DUF503 domain-containing protein [bacterium]|nr:DUF503 domain-containing protein [bacterium]
MQVLVLEVEFLVPGARSLKDKRRVVRSLKDRLSHRFNAAVAETDFQQQWGRGALGMAMVGNDGAYLQQQMNKALLLIESEPEIDPVKIEREIV